MHQGSTWAGAEGLRNQPLPTRDRPLGRLCRPFQSFSEAPSSWASAGPGLPSVPTETKHDAWQTTQVTGDTPGGHSSLDSKGRKGLSLFPLGPRSHLQKGSRACRHPVTGPRVPRGTWLAPPRCPSAPSGGCTGPGSTGPSPQPVLRHLTWDSPPGLRPPSPPGRSSPSRTLRACVVSPQSGLSESPPGPSTHGDDTLRGPTRLPRSS